MIEEMQESELGTKEYWDKCYEEEINNFNSHGDPGEVWFGEDIMERTISWITKKMPKETNPKILDLGCGNGMFLIQLSSEGYQNLYGVDYSEKAVALAKSIADKHVCSIQFSVCNILNGIDSCFDVVHDKGTYDAITLNKDAKSYRSMYIKSVYESLHNKAYLIITSCNWTIDELNEHFKGYFTCIDVIPTPQFRFGGKTGNIVTSAIYTKNQMT